MKKLESVSSSGLGFCNVVLGGDSSDVCCDNVAFRPVRAPPIAPTRSRQLLDCSNDWSGADLDYGWPN